MFPIFAGNSASTGYNLTRSLRFRASASAYLNRTPAAAGNLLTWTWSGWVKLGSLANGQCLLSAGTSTSNVNQFYFDLSTNQFVYFNYYSGAYQFNVNSTAVYRDPSAWYHVVFVLDTTQATSTNRAKLYVNGSQITLNAGTGGFGVQNQSSIINNTVAHNIGRYVTFTNYFDGYLTEVNFIDGQALTPSSFGSTNALTGVWQPARYTGTYGTNGFYLPFTDNSALTTSSNVGLGKDFSGNGNYWTTNNISITAGVTYDSMTDVPTLTSATAANFAVLNPLQNYGTMTNGNLTFAGSSESTVGTIAVSSGKTYYEVTVSTLGTSAFLGFANLTWQGKDNSWTYSQTWVYIASGNKGGNGATGAYGASYTTGDVIGIALDSTTGTLEFYKNNTSQGVAFSTGLAGVVVVPFIATASPSTTTLNVNFGQRPFTYSPPTGFVALNCYNLPTSTILAGNKVMDATLYSGNLIGQVITNAGTFKPDLVWVKSRSAATDNKLTDSVRGATIALVSNSTAAETTDVTGVVSFNSNGFTLGTSTTYNNTGATYVGWQWQAGQGSTSTNTNGTITSTVSVNASAGFSVVTWTYNSSGGTIGHGLGVAPQLIIQKDRTNGSYSWDVYHASLGATQRLSLNSTNATQSQIVWNNTSPTSSVFSSGASWYTNADSMVSYCWTPIAGYSAFGSITGNGSADGPFTYTGFRPKFILFKNASAVASWWIFDTVRNTYNVADLGLRPNLSDAESNFPTFDILSNGFKVRTTDAGLNGSGNTIVYACWAENPFKNSLAR